MYTESNVNPVNCEHCVFVKNDKLMQTLFCGNIRCEHKGISVYPWDICPFFQGRTKGRKIAVDKIDPKTNKVIDSYISISEAARNNGVSMSSVRWNLDGITRTCGGFIYRLHRFDVGKID